MLIGFNQRFKAENAKAVYMPQNPQEVAVAMDDILDNYKTGLKVRSGGHCYENFVMNEGTNGIIDVGDLVDWGQDQRGYYLSSGETNWSAFNKIFKHWGVVLPGGSCYSVGLGGHISGGGDGIMSRLYGTTVDWLTGIEIVVKDDPDQPAYVKYVGEKSEGDDADLFWACKGAGNGNFGVITKYYFKELPKAPEGAVISTLAFNWHDDDGNVILDAESLKRILDEYVDFAARNDNRESSGKFQIYHEAAGQALMTIHTAYFNDTTKCEAKKFHYELQKKLEEFYTVSTPIGAFGGGHIGYCVGRSKNFKDIEDAVEDTIHDFTFYDSTQTMNPSGGNQRGKYKSAYMKERFPIEQCEAIIDNMRRVPEGLEMHDMKQSICQIDCFGGRINDFTPEETALAQREYVVKLQFQTYWVDEDKDDLHLGWIRKFYHEDMYGQYGGIPDPKQSDMFEGCYYNYPDVDLNDEQYGGLEKAMYLYFLENYRENKRNLVDVKKRWDPANFFNNEQSIPID